MGLGFGGEWAAGAVLMGEVIRAEHRGKVVGTVQSAWAIGWGVAAILSTVLFTLLPQDTAWRALFWIGLLPAVLVIFIRRFVEDPPVFKAAKARIASAGLKQMPLEIFSPQILTTTILTCLLATGAQGGYYALFTWLPTYLKVERKLSVVLSITHNSVCV
jgi:MFS family permease